MHATILDNPVLYPVSLRRIIHPFRNFLLLVNIIIRNIYFNVSASYIFCGIKDIFWTFRLWLRHTVAKYITTTMGKTIKRVPADWDLKNRNEAAVSGSSAADGLSRIGFFLSITMNAR